MKVEMSVMTKAVANIVREQVLAVEKGFRGEIETLLERIKVLEETPRSIKGDPGEPGKSADPITDEQVSKAVESYMAENPLPVPTNGKDAESITIDDIEPLVTAKQAEWALDFERRAQGIFQSVIDRLPTPKDGEDADEDQIVKSVLNRLSPSGVDKDEVAGICAELVTAEVAKIPTPQNGKDADPITDKQVFEAVRKYIDANPLPVPKDGKDAQVDEAKLSDQVSKAVSAYLKDHPPKDGERGESTTAEDVMPAIMAEVQKALDAIPVPKDGNSVAVEDVLPQLTEKVQKAIDSMPVPKDGTSITLNDVQPLLKSMQSEWALDFEKRAQDLLQKAIDRMPKPKDGKDAMSVEDFDFGIDEDGRTITMGFTNGSGRKEHKIKTQIPAYKEIWSKDAAYERGHLVTFSGSMWIALKDNTNSRPGQFNKCWRLCVKKGHDGKST